MVWFAGFLVALAVIAAAPFALARIREKPLTPHERRQNAPGRAVSLSDGVVHVVERGPPDGRPIVLVHGFSAPCFVFEQNAVALEEAGFRVIQFDHFGRGWSDRPHTTYDIDFFDRELIDLLNALDLSHPVGLVGYSMGGVIAAEFAARHPDRVAGLCLLAPAGLSVVLYSGFLSRLLRWPLVGDWIWRIRGWDLLTQNPQYDDSSLAPERRLQGDVSRQLVYRGCLPAILATWRHLPMRDRDQAFGKAAGSGVPILAVFGGRDSVIGPDSADRLRAVAPSARIEILPEGDHALPYELHDLVNPLMTDFFRDDHARWDRAHPQTLPRGTPSSR